MWNKPFLLGIYEVSSEYSQLWNHSDWPSNELFGFISFSQTQEIFERPVALHLPWFYTGSNRCGTYKWNSNNVQPPGTCRNRSNATAASLGSAHVSKRWWLVGGAIKGHPAGSPVHRMRTHYILCRQKRYLMYDRKQLLRIKIRDQLNPDSFTALARENFQVILALAFPSFPFIHAYSRKRAKSYLRSIGKTRSGYSKLCWAAKKV